MKAWRLILLLVLFCAWYFLSAEPVPALVLLSVALLGPVGLLLSAWLGRRSLDRTPTPEAARQVTERVHDAVLALLGSAAIAAVRLFQAHPGWYIPLPDSVGLALFVLSLLLLLVSTANLVLSGLGVPIAVLQTRRLAADWLYAWTRNPIVLSALVMMVCMGLWLHSTWLIIWTLGIMTPVAVAVLRIFEERELEIRFGAEYLEYKARTPMLFPRVPHSVRHSSHGPTQTGQGTS